MGRLMVQPRLDHSHNVDQKKRLKNSFGPTCPMCPMLMMYLYAHAYARACVRTHTRLMLKM